MKKISLDFLGFVQATTLVVYLILVNLFIRKISTHFSDNEIFIGPIIFLLTFILSAVISASTVLGQAGVLFWEKKFKEAFTLLGWTVLWGIIYLGIFLFASFR